MQRQRIFASFDDFPVFVHPFMKDAAVYDSSCSPEAKVWFLDKDGGYYLKSAPKGELEREAALTRWYHQKGLGAEVLFYVSAEQDWLCTARIPGEDCTHPLYLHDPKRLCDLLAQQLRALHETDFTGCPVTNHTELYLKTAEENYAKGQFDLSYFPEAKTAEEAWKVLEEGKQLLKTDTLLHGDYCLPNIMLDMWRFRGFVDLGRGGIGDRHIDLFWGAWTLNFNLKTDEYRQRFFDAYGRDAMEEETLRMIGAAEVFG